MVEILDKKFNQDELLSSINFIKKADSVFTASLNKEDIEFLGFKNIEILETENELITFLNLSLRIRENDVIYSHANYVESLFKILETLKFKNIKIICNIFKYALITFFLSSSSYIKKCIHHKRLRSACDAQTLAPGYPGLI